MGGPVSSGKQNRTKRRRQRGRTRLEVQDALWRPASSFATPSVLVPSHRTSHLPPTCSSICLQVKDSPTTVWERAGSKRFPCLVGDLPGRWGEEGPEAQPGPEKERGH